MTDCGDLFIAGGFLGSGGGKTMKVERSFLVAPAMVRLLQRERMTSRDIMEGYLSRTPEIVQFVRVEPDGCNVILLANGSGQQTEDRARVSAAQAKALMDVCQGRIGYRRHGIRIGLGLDVYLTRFEGLDLVSVQFDDAASAAAFTPPHWFGREVTEEPAYQNSSFALDGMPESEDVNVSNSTIIAFLDSVQGSPAVEQAGQNLTAGDGPASMELAAVVEDGRIRRFSPACQMRWPRRPSPVRRSRCPLCCPRRSAEPPGEHMLISVELLGAVAIASVISTVLVAGAVVLLAAGF